MAGRSRSPRRPRAGSSSKLSGSKSRARVSPKPEFRSVDRSGRHHSSSQSGERRSRRQSGDTQERQKRPRLSPARRPDRVASPVFGVPIERSPDHSRPRHGPSHPKPRSPGPQRKRSPDKNRKHHIPPPSSQNNSYRTGPSHRRSPSPRTGPPRDYGPFRGRSPGYGASRQNHRTSKIHSPEFFPHPRHHSPPRNRSPGLGYGRGGMRSPMSGYRGGPRPQRSPGRSPPYRGGPHHRGGTVRRYSSPTTKRPRSRSPVRTAYRSPNRYEMEPPPGPSVYGHDRSPPDVPRVPRDQRSPPRIRSPRPKHMRSPVHSTNHRAASPPSRSPAQSSPRIERAGRLGSPKQAHRPGKSHEVSNYSKSSQKPSAPPPPSISRQCSSSPKVSKFSSITVAVSEQGGSRKRAVLDKSSEDKDNKDMAVSNTSTGVSGDWSVFRGPEMGKIDTRELKKIQIDIRRSIAEHKIMDIPVVRGLMDPLKLIIPRRGNEGNKQIFDREEIVKHASKEEKVEEQRVMIITEPLEEYERKLGSEIVEGLEDVGGKSKERSRSPREKKREDRGRKRERSPRRDENLSPEKSVRKRLGEKDGQSGERGDRVDIRARLGGREKSPRDSRDVRERLGDRQGERGGGGVSVRQRLGEQVMDRERLEAGRPDVKPWDVEPELVPREGRYWGHDSREEEMLLWERERGGDRDGRSGFSHRGHYRGGRSSRSPRGRGGFHPYRGRGRRQDYGGRRSETDWKHDKFHNQEEEPSSTTD